MIARHTFTILVAAVLALGLVGCDTLDVEPEQSIPEEEAFTSVTDAEAALNGAYDGLQLPGNYGGFPVVAADFQSGNSSFSGSFSTWSAAQSFNITSTHGPSLTVWDDHYDVILRLNTIIARASEVPDISSADLDRITGEAQFLRALMYFDLVRWFAQPYNIGGTNDQLGVPLTLEPLRTLEQATDSEFTDQPRATVDAVYSQIYTDLNDAVSKLGGISNRNRGSGTAAQALRAKVNLYTGDYQGAIDDAEAVIGSGDMSLVESVSSIYASVSETNTEIIFSVANNEIDNSGTNDFPSAFYLPSDFGGRGDINPTSDLISLYETSDERGLGQASAPNSGDFLIYAYGGAPWTNKWSDSNFGDDAIVLRGAEMYLIAAEAIARSDYAAREDDAEDYLNTVRTRAGASSVNTSSQQDLIDAVLLERRLELAFEGDYRHDLVRTGSPMRTTVQGDPQRILPIPQTEIEINSEISEDDQNPGY
ncbi:hypothetical protein CRI94_08590 [Longibacter salinarum]|uniref:RagB/SusD family nutrient uptake outer membrane protein n=1 Tax=Longibacter salinarum TaxID=1850348 RepID=A0A2A8CXE9_9BACT|nr:RagB/SusD family nutrient uptake outer membrane protein [Longibacter salinarum]PEN13375.1 hypothetical protein CRI94_08590 [Longibacter salinarum]